MTPTSRLPTFEMVRRRARMLLGDARDELNSDTRDHLAGRVTAHQAQCVQRALEAIGEAKSWLDAAAER